MVNCSTCEQTARGHAVLTNIAIGQHNHRELIVNCLFGFVANPIQRRLNTGFTKLTIEGDIDRLRFPTAVGHVLDGRQFLIGENRMGDHETMAVGRCRVQQILFWTNIAFQRHDDFFTNRIDGWIGNLSKELFEIIVDQSGLVA